MKGAVADNHETAKWDPAFTKQITNAIGPWIKRWYRAEVRHVHNVPAAGGALVVSNHSGGLFPMDVPVFATGFYEMFGYAYSTAAALCYICFDSPL